MYDMILITCRLHVIIVVCLSFLVIEAEKLEVHAFLNYMVKKLSEKQFTNMSDDTFTIHVYIYFNYNLLDCMENAV